jgi:predicted PurR-regulated permease PerM
MKNALKIIAALAGIALGLYLLYVLRTLLIYLLIAIVLSLIGQPVMRLLQKLKIGRFQLPGALSALLTMLLFLLILTGVFSLFVPLVAEQARIISSIDTNEVVQQLEGPYKNIRHFSAKYRLNDQAYNQEYFQQKVSELLQFSKISFVVENLISVLGNIFVALFSITFMTFFFLKDGKLLEKILFNLTPDSHEPKAAAILENSKKLLRRYFIGMFIQIALITIILSIALSILGVKNALLIGFLGALLNLIPYIGPIIGGIIGILITLITHLHLDFQSELIPMLLGVALIFVGTQLLDNIVLQPIIFSNSVSAHPLEIFLVISIAGTIGGITGMVVAIPFYTLLRVVAKELLSEYKVVSSLTKDL